MRVLIIGSGGREHALAWAIAFSPLLTKLYVAPGNPGTAALAENVPIPASNIAKLIEFAIAQKIDLVIPGPEAPLVAGIADACAAAGIACLGPTAAAAQLEGSKAFCKDIADAAGIPTADWAEFTDEDEAHDYIEDVGAPIVIKADGLAAGKGVVVAATEDEAHDAVHAIMGDKIHGAAGAKIVIEECLFGEEISVFALCDGLDAVYLGVAADHKRVGDNDTGPNTGGMGAISPPPWASQEILDETMQRVIRPALAAMVERGTPFRGFLFAGLMVTEDGPKLIEFNVRFGDPECETLLPLMQSDLLAVLQAATNGTLKNAAITWKRAASAPVVMCSK
ncbi:MAG: phosphoribosylamine--glycine ligase, partial [Acidocella sp.]|nr:phosphoribosylamine--glycine ligase [Acidocella sp.]